MAPVTAAVPAATIVVAPLSAEPIPPAILIPAFFPALVASGSRTDEIEPLMPCADGIICTYACPSSAAIEFPPFLFKVSTCLKRLCFL